MENVELVFRTFMESEKPLKGGEVAEISGLDKKDVDKAIKILKKEEKIFSPKRCFYDVKK
jgi:hypothetical protein